MNKTQNKGKTTMAKYTILYKNVGTMDTVRTVDGNVYTFYADARTEKSAIKKFHDTRVFRVKGFTKAFKSAVVKVGIKGYRIIKVSKG